VTRLVVLLAVLACTLWAACGCGDHHASDGKLTADYSGSGPGTLIDARTLTDLDPQLRSAASQAARITYASRSGVDDSDSKVTAAVFVPQGEPPQGGWPVVAFGHPATGSRPECAPSQSPTLLGSAPMVTALLQAGYVVTVSDYQGLGLSGTYHPFLDSTTVGLNLIDSVAAARKLVSNASPNWVAFGVGQGGQAAWAANELNDNDGAGLSLRGAVSVAPLADLDGLADAAVAGQLTAEQELAWQGYLAALKSEYHDLNLDDYRRGIVGDKWDVLSACAGSALAERNTVAGQITPADFQPSSPAATDTLRGYLKKTTLPQGPTAAPMFVVYSGSDPLMPADWTDRALARACQMGDTVQVDLQADKAPADIDMSTAFAWIKDRFNGVPATNDCPSITAKET
jgi:alpha-beta hydrolase superfamily lysophospholipase